MKKQKKKVQQIWSKQVLNRLRRLLRKLAFRNEQTSGLAALFRQIIFQWSGLQLMQPSEVSSAGVYTIAMMSVTTNNMNAVLRFDTSELVQFCSMLLALAGSDFTSCCCLGVFRLLHRPFPALFSFCRVCVDLFWLVSSVGVVVLSVLKLTSTRHVSLMSSSGELDCLPPLDESISLLRSWPLLNKSEHSLLSTFTGADLLEPSRPVRLSSVSLVIVLFLLPDGLPIYELAFCLDKI